MHICIQIINPMVAGLALIMFKLGLKIVELEKFCPKFSLGLVIKTLNHSHFELFLGPVQPLQGEIGNLPSMQRR